MLFVIHGTGGTVLPNGAASALKYRSNITIQWVRDAVLHEEERRDPFGFVSG